MKKFAEYSNFNLSEINKEVLKDWEKDNIFQKSIETREGCPTFVFYEGPPSANGMPGIHHVMSRAIKDIFCRYKTMQGFQVKRKAGWDTHGLPVELGVEKMLGITKEDIGTKISVDEYNSACRREVMKYTKEWEDMTRKVGYWVDMEHPYVTYENKYIESLWWLLKQLYNKGLLYKGYTIQPYSPAAGTGLSSHELNQPGCYRDVKDTTCVAQFKVKAPLNLPSRGDFAEVQNSSEAHLNKLYNTANSVSYEFLKENAKNRRKNPTEAENFLWQNLNGKQLDGYKFRREHVIGDFIVDFICLSKQLIIEVDGGYHNDKDVQEFDKMRSEYLNEKGFKVIRFTNEEVLNNIEKTLETIKIALRQSLPEGDLEGTYFLAWTTTPWTLPSNTALCVGEKIDYVKVKTQNPYTKAEVNLILAEALLDNVMGKNEYEIVEKYKGKDLVGIEYEQLIPWVNPGEGAFRVISGDFVTTEDGTGIVHIAPTFGADDAKVAKNFGVPPILLTDKNGNQRPMVDLTGKFYKIEDLDKDFVKTNVNVDLYKDFAGRFVKKEYSDAETEDLNVDLCVMLKQQGLAFKIEKHTHNYPHCWRTDKPVLYYPLDSWFIKSTACREEMIKLNDTINWKPASTGTGRFGKWLENLNDWNLSRSRYWGTPLPIWRTEDGTEEICIGSVEELMREMDKSVAIGFMKENPFKNFKVSDYSEENYSVKNLDLHRPYVDNIILVSPSGKPMKRELDLIDVWFDSGAMPFAQMHYPFENKDIIDNGDVYPADFISEGVDQTRGWFFTLHAISAMIKGNVAFKNVISNGLVLDKNGNKMSKRLGNAVDPFTTIEKYGSDPLRWYMMTNASPWDNLKFDIEGIEEVRRKFFGTLYNTYSFFALYANVDGFACEEPQIPVAERPEIDRWIISLLNTLIKDVTEYYETYEPTRAGRAIADFVGENLSNWYVRLNRKRYWGGEYDKDKISAYQTLYTCLETVVKLMAPIAPFYADRLYKDLAAPLNLPSRGDFSTEQNSKLYNTANPLSYEILKENAKNRRKNSTEAEKFLWENLKNKELENYKFRREHVIGDCIADSVCLSKQLVIEVDGGYHNEKNQKEFDQIRTEYLNQKGFSVIRFTNEEVLFDIEKTLNTIKSALAQVSPEGRFSGASVHLTNFPVYDETLIDKHLEQCMDLAQKSSSMILALRKKAEKKVRQPLSKVVIPASDETMYKQMQYIADLVKTEVNVKEIEVISPDVEMAGLVKKIKPNFKTLGKKYGKQMKEIANAMTDFSQTQISEIEQKGNYILSLPSGNVELAQEDVEIATEDMPGWLVANEGKMTVALDITVTPKLLKEGIARELVNRIQNIRKSNGYEITDKINIQIEAKDEINETVKEYGQYIATQTLGKSIELVEKINNPTILDFEDYQVNVFIEKI